MEPMQTTPASKIAAPHMPNMNKPVTKSGSAPAANKSGKDKSDKDKPKKEAKPRDAHIRISFVGATKTFTDKVSQPHKWDEIRKLDYSSLVPYLQNVKERVKLEKADAAIERAKKARETNAANMKGPATGA